ncbi:MAG: bifunctional 4-hydroxy-2-oxoglutarate aldolase/2-dehydro-3-deoxy-phosphogluconate aldolase [Marmoricola sp.]
MPASSAHLDEPAGAPSQSASGLEMLLVRHRVVAVVRAPEIPDAAALCEALLAGGIGLVELTFTTPDLARHIRTASAFAASVPGHDLVVGVGTVTRVDQARAAIDAGAGFLVTPGLGAFAAGVVEAAHDAEVPVLLGAFTPSEVLAATELGADAVKVFPASVGGTRLVSDLRGPFPDVAFVPSGGVTGANARAFLDAGAVAVSAGSGVVSPAAVTSGDWRGITSAARDFRARLESAAESR